MGRPRSFRINLIILLAAFLQLFQAPAQAVTESEALKLLISVEQQTITVPFPARVTLHLHNSGQAPLWLYRRVRGSTGASSGEASPFGVDDERTHQTPGGSTLAIRLEPVRIQEGQPNRIPEIALPAQGRVLESVGLPHPKLVRLAPGEDYEEKTVVRLAPALGGTASKDEPIWGRYRFSAIYAAEYSNGKEIATNLGIVVWQGKIPSNVIELELKPPAASAQGSVAGAVTDSEKRPASGVLVSLSDQEERLVDQLLTDSEGRFSFIHLPFGLYWVTVRRQNSPEDTVMFRHVGLTPAQPAGTMQFMLLNQEIYEAKQMLHKPVLFRVTDSAGRPVDRTTLDITWSSGTVLDHVKGEVLEDGTLALELIPGRNYATLKRRGCPKQDERVDVEAGGGIDGFQVVLECARK